MTFRIIASASGFISLIQILRSEKLFYLFTRKLLPAVENRYN